MPSLDEQIKARREQAEDRRIHEKVAVVARHLGSYDSWDESNRKGHKSSYEQGNLRITDSSSFEDLGDGGAAASGSSIIYKGNVVFSEEGSTINSYIPGPWEGILTKLYKRAKRISDKEHEERRGETEKEEEERKDQERSKWGF